MRCTAVFLILVVLFYAFVHSPNVKTGFWHDYLVLHANIAAAILNFLGSEVHVSETSVVGTNFVMEIVRGCDAIEPIAIYIAAVIASPLPIVARLIGIVVGALAIAIVNIFRLIVLFWIGTYWPRVFDIAHEGVWQVILIGIAIVFWTIWVDWAKPKPAEPTNVSS